jgi:hypothetical protein
MLPLLGRRRRRPARRGSERGGLGEVELGAAAAEPERGAVVGPRGGLGRIEGAQPHARRLVRVPDLRRPLPPRPLPHSAVPPPRRRAVAGAGAAAASTSRRRGRELVVVRAGAVLRGASRRRPVLLRQLRRAVACMEGHRGWLLSAHLCFSHALFFFLSLEHRSRDMQFAYPQSQYGILLFESNLISVKFIYLAVDIFDCEKIGNYKVINKLVPFV